MRKHKYPDFHSAIAEWEKARQSLPRGWKEFVAPPGWMPWFEYDPMDGSSLNSVVYIDHNARFTLCRTECDEEDWTSYRSLAEAMAEASRI